MEQRKAWELSAKSLSPGIIPMLWELASKTCSLPAYLIQQYSLDWHHISQTQVPSQRKEVLLAAEHVLDVSHWSKNSSHRGRLAFCRRNIKEAWFQVHNGLQKLSVLEDKKKNTVIIVALWHYKNESAQKRLSSDMSYSRMIERCFVPKALTFLT